jgi:hypothetical protein
MQATCSDSTVRTDTTDRPVNKQDPITRLKGLIRETLARIDIELIDRDNP